MIASIGIEDMVILAHRPFVRYRVVAKATVGDTVLILFDAENNSYKANCNDDEMYGVILEKAFGEFGQRVIKSSEEMKLAEYESNYETVIYRHDIGDGLILEATTPMRPEKVTALGLHSKNNGTRWFSSPLCREFAKYVYPTSMTRHDRELLKYIIDHARDDEHVCYCSLTEGIEIAEGFLHGRDRSVSYLTGFGNSVHGKLFIVGDDTWSVFQTVGIV